MYITITIETKEGKADIRIDCEQQISQGLKVLRESGKLPQGKEPSFFRSYIRETLVSGYKKFREENIFDGDILVAID